MNTGTTTKKLRNAIAELRVLCPTKHPVVVRRTKMADDDFGDAELLTQRKRHFKIRLNSSLPVQFQIWVLVHEWAHCMVWDVTHSRHDDHGAFFGIAYSEAYQAIYR